MSKKIASGGGKNLDLSDLSQLGPEDRIAVMRMVKDGEISVDEAVRRVKGDADLKKLAKSGGGGLRRRDGVKKGFRGRVNLDIEVIKANAFSVLKLDLKDCRDLMGMNKNMDSDPYIKMYIYSGNEPDKSTKKKTTVHKNTRNPIFNESFTWDIRSNADLNNLRLHLSVWDYEKGLKKNQFMGAMSFSLAELWEGGKDNPDVPMHGWFRLLDDKKGEYQNMPWKKGPAVVAANAGIGANIKLQTLPPSEAKREARGVIADSDPKSSYTNVTFGVEKKTPARLSDNNPFAPTPEAAPEAARRPSAITSTTPRVSPRVSPTSTPVPSQRSEPSRTAPVQSVPVQRAQPPPQQAAVVPVAKKMEKVSASSFTFLKKLGEGSFGKVMLAERKGNQDELFAIKIIKKEMVIEDDDVECTMTERRVLALSNGCEFLTKLHATFQSSDCLFFVMEFINGGDLMFHIQKEKQFAADQVQFYVAELCLGLWYLHDHGVLYRDLKLDNVMLDSEGHIKIADFGMCKENIFGTGVTSTFCGTPGYLAPEIVADKPYGASVDWWSLGVLTYEMCEGDSPFDTADDDELFEQIQKKKIVFRVTKHQVVKDIILGFMTRDPKTRLGCSPTGKQDIKSHAYFGTLNWEKVASRQMKPPFNPKVKNARSADNFDKEFTDKGADLTPPNAEAVGKIDQALFSEFSFVNPGFGKFQDAAGVSAGKPAGPALTSFSWYRPDLPRDRQAVELKNKPAGTFFMRESTSQPGCYAIAMSMGPDAPPCNKLILPSVDTSKMPRFRLYANVKFDSLPELVHFYSSSPVDQLNGKPVFLRAP